MQTYKIGNKINCIIRIFSAGKIGDEEMVYDNQPYTCLKDVEATLTYNEFEKEAKVINTELAYNIDFVSGIKLSNVLLTDKILKLIYGKNEEKLCHTVKEFASHNGKIYIPLDAEKIYQVFVYNKNGELEAAYGELSLDTPLEVAEENDNYLIFYSYEGKTSVDLNRLTNIYVTLDLEVVGNIDDETTSMWLHLYKCALTPNKTLYFDRYSNTIDLEFTILKGDRPNYITFN